MSKSDHKGLICLYVAFLVLLCSHVQSQTQKREIRVTPGDAIRIYVYDNLFPSEKSKFISLFHEKEFIIDGEGNINLGPIGKVSMAGLKAEEIAEILREKFKPFAKDPLIMIIPLVRIGLKGGFNLPGQYRVNLSMSFWEMVKEVGGIISMANFEDMYIVRDRQIIYRNFGEAFYKAQSLYELGIESGDEIYAPRVNRLTFATIIRYIQFGMSLLTFYFSLMNYSKR